MKKPQRIQREIEKTLEIADKIQAQEAPAYLYARIARKLEGQATHPDTFVWNPPWRWALAGLGILLLLNIGSIAREWVQYGDQNYEVLAKRYYGEPNSVYENIDK